MIKFGSNGHKQKETVLNFWVMPNAGFATRDVMQPFINEFEEKHPGVKVHLTIHPWSLTWNRLIDVIKGRYPGPRPDIIQVGTTWVATLAYLGALEKVPSSNVLMSEDRQSAYIWDPGSQNDPGQDLYCVPWFIDVRVLYYRRDLFERLGINPELLQDWKGFFRVCLELKKFLTRGGPIPRILAPIGMPGQNPGVLMHDLAPWIWAAGGDFCSEDLVSATMSEDASLKGFEFYYDLINQGFMGSPDNSAEQGRSGISFFSGHYAMQFSGAWPIDTFLNKDCALANMEVRDGFDIALIPAGPHGRFSFLGGSNLGVASVSDKKDLAWELVRFLSEPKNQLQHARGVGALTARLASLEELFEKYPNQKKVFWDSLGHARRLPRLIELGSVEQIIYNMGLTVLHLIRTGTYNHKRLEEEIKAANASMDSVLSLHRYGAEVNNGATK